MTKIKRVKYIFIYCVSNKKDSTGRKLYISALAKHTEKIDHKHNKK